MLEIVCPEPEERETVNILGHFIKIIALKY